MKAAKHRELFKAEPGTELQLFQGQKDVLWNVHYMFVLFDVS